MRQRPSATIPVRGYGSRRSPGRPGDRLSLMSRLMLLLCQLLVAVVALSLWQLLATVPMFGRLLLPPFFFSNPLDVGSQILDWFRTGVIWKHLAITLWESILAFAIGSLGGVMVGFWFARQATVAAGFGPFVEMGRAPARGARDLVEGRARGHAGVLHRVLQRLSGRQGGQRHRARQCPHARDERAAADPARLLALGAVVDVFLAAHLGRLCRGRRRGRRISGVRG